MNRKQKRNDSKKMYSWEECKQIALRMVIETERKYDIRYSTCLATALAAAPTNFGPKRVCRVVKLFFDQIEGLKLKTLDEDQIREEAEKLGVVVNTIDDKTEIYIDPRVRRKEKKDGSKR